MKNLFSVASILLAGVSTLHAQQTLNSLQLNTITTAVPFLGINPESRGGGMGDVGVSTSADGASMHWNNAKYAFIEDKAGVSISYTPWLRSLVPDISLSYLTGYYKIDKMSAVSASIRYFSLGNIQFTDEFGTSTIAFNPNEFSIDLGYSRKLAKRLSAGLVAKYITSNLTARQVVGGASTKPGRTIAVDLSTFYENDDVVLFKKDAQVAWGVNISNLGAKISYSNTTTRDYLPINLRMGPRVTLDLDDYNSFSVALDLNKYLVPTPPVYLLDEDGKIVVENNQPVIFSGMDPDRPLPVGVVSSFYDAPGNVTLDEDGNQVVSPGSRFGEELREVTLGLGTEYWYDKQFAARAGYFYEHRTKGNRSFLTLGLGLKLNVFALDFSYLIPANFNRNQIQNISPLARTLRFSLAFNFADTKKASGTTTE